MSNELKEQIQKLVAENEAGRRTELVKQRLQQQVSPPSKQSQQPQQAVQPKPSATQTRTTPHHDMPFGTRAELDMELERQKEIRDAHRRSRDRHCRKKAREANEKIQELTKLCQGGNFPSVKELEKKIANVDQKIEDLDDLDPRVDELLEQCDNLKKRLALEKKMSRPQELKRSSDALSKSYYSLAPPDAIPDLPTSYLQLCTNNFSLEKSENGFYLGGGGFADVFLGIDTRTGLQFAVKKHHEYLIQGKHGEALQKQIVREVEVLSKLHHPNIVRLLAYSSESKCLVYEYAQGGSLADILVDQNDKKLLGWRMRLDVIYAVTSALKHLWSKGCSHRDVKPDNICFTEDMSRVVLIDFGLAKLVDDEKHRKTVTGLAGWSVPYAAPEYMYGQLRDKKTKEIVFDESCEVYSLGFVMQALITGSLPLPGKKPLTHDQLVAAGRGDAPNAGHWDEMALSKLAQLTVQSTVEQWDYRPTLDQVLNVLGKLKEACMPEPTPDQVTFFQTVMCNSHYEPVRDVALSRQRGHCCSCGRTEDKGLVCNRPSNSTPSHFICHHCFQEHVKQNIGDIDMWCFCRDTTCKVSYPFTERQLIDHLDPDVADEHFQTRNEKIQKMRAEQIESARQRDFAQEEIKSMLVSLNKYAKVHKAALEKMAEDELACPTLYVLNKARSAKGNRRMAKFAPKLRNPIRMKKLYILRFVCACDGKPIEYGIPLMKDKAWVRKAAPVLLGSLWALRIVLGVVVHVDLPLDKWFAELGLDGILTEDALRNFLESEAVEDQLKRLDEKLRKMSLGANASVDGLSEALTEVQNLNDGRGYVDIEKIANSEPHSRGWRREMSCASNETIGMAWVKKDNKEEFEKKVLWIITLMGGQKEIVRMLEVEREKVAKYMSRPTR